MPSTDLDSYLIKPPDDVIGPAEPMGRAQRFSGQGRMSSKSLQYQIGYQITDIRLITGIGYFRIVIISEHGPLHDDVAHSGPREQRVKVLQSAVLSALDINFYDRLSEVQSVSQTA